MTKELSEELLKVHLRIQEMFIDTMGSMVYAAGERRLIGRVIGLLISVGEAVSLTEISQRLQLTKSAVSNVLTNIERRGLIERVYNPDEPRSAYYQMKENYWEFFIEEHKREINNLIGLANKVLDELDSIRPQEGEPPEEFARMHEPVRILQHFYVKLAEAIKHIKSTIFEEQEGIEPDSTASLTTGRSVR
ncbi:GbsR/MarR family transcriptional regulator [candidate division KSB1 bacterium]